MFFLWLKSALTTLIFLSSLPSFSICSREATKFEGNEANHGGPFLLSMDGWRRRGHVKQLCVLSWEVRGFWERFTTRDTLEKRQDVATCGCDRQSSWGYEGSLLKLAWGYEGTTCHADNGRAKRLKYQILRFLSLSSMEPFYHGISYNLR